MNQHTKSRMDGGDGLDRSGHEFCFGETCCSDPPLASAIATAIENPPKFYPSDRVKVRGRIEGQNQATVIEGPVTRIWFGKASETYLIALDHKTYQARDGIKQSEQWCSVLLLTRIVGCPCSEGCEAKEGEAH